MATQQYQRAAWRGMCTNLGVSAADMHHILSQLHGAHQRHALALRDADSAVSAWVTTRHVLRLVSQWNWARNEWPYLASGRLEQWIAHKDMEFGLGNECERTPPVLRKRKAVAHTDDTDTRMTKVKTALMILTEACEEARNALDY